MEKTNKEWFEDPNTEFECVSCKTIWKLKDSVSCPKCDGINKVDL